MILPRITQIFADKKKRSIPTAFHLCLDPWDPRKISEIDAGGMVSFRVFGMFRGYWLGYGGLLCAPLLFALCPKDSPVRAGNEQRSCHSFVPLRILRETLSLGKGFSCG